MPKPPDNLEEILAAVAGGNLSPAEAAGRLREGEVRYLDEFAVLDLGRAARKGVPEIVYAPGKTPAQVAKICASILEHSERVVVSGPTPEQERLLHETLPGVPVKSFHDVGVAGIHRLAEPLRDLRSFDPDCVIVAAGMEGALPSVVSSLVAVPVVGLPTSTGYGLGGDGTAAILGMLQSCSPGLSVVNVDNGTGAGVAAALVANRAATYRENLRASD